MIDRTGLTANLQSATLNTANIGVGSYIMNDYLITIEESEDGNGYTMEVRKGSQTQTIHLTELTPEYVNTLITDALTVAKRNGEFDGFSPIATVEDSVIGTKISITDKNGTTTRYVRDGKDGKDGADGTSPIIVAMRNADGVGVVVTNAGETLYRSQVYDGYSPTANVVKNGNTATITVTDKNGTSTAQVTDGETVPLSVRQAILALLETVDYESAGLTNEIQIIRSWASV